MIEIWNKRTDYTIFRPYIEWAARNSYSKITVKGLENIPDPEKNSVFITPNHTNTLMDSLVVLQSRVQPTAFLARADIFRIKVIATCLERIKILPIYRHRDTADSQSLNEPIYENIVECVTRGLPMCIFPEGTHRPRRSLLPLKKGVFYMALQAKRTYPDRPVYIVPAGIEYADYYNNMMPVTLTYGTPIEIKGDETPDDLVPVLREKLSSLITYFPDDENLAENERNFEIRCAPEFSLKDYVLAVLLLPVFAASGFLCVPAVLMAAVLGSKLKDKAWLNTVRFCCKLFFTPFCTLGALIAGFIHLPWYGALLLAAATLYAHPVFYRILVFYKRLLND